MEEFKLPYIDALEKVLKIVKRDAEHIPAETSGFEMKTQIENLLECYSHIDPDTAFRKYNEMEKNQKTLMEEIAFIFKAHFIQSHKLQHHPNRRFNFADGVRFQHLLSKYHLSITNDVIINSWSIMAISLVFPDVQYNVQKENPSLCRGLPDEMKRYKNFKREYDVEGIVALLPPGKKYGGFIKAYMHHILMANFNENPEFVFFFTHLFQSILAKLRKIYNSTIFSIEKRQEWFQKLGIQETDCALWSRLFDQQYPGYKDVHKFFEQVA